MDQSQTCPLFVDFTRECIEEFEVYPGEITQEMIGFCRTPLHSNCPFYKMIKTDTPVCKNIKKCPAFKHFQSENFDEFVRMSNKFCTSKDHVTCQRYIIKEKEEEVPIDLHPDGRRIPEWKEEEK